MHIDVYGGLPVRRVVQPFLRQLIVSIDQIERWKQVCVQDYEVAVGYLFGGRY